MAKKIMMMETTYGTLRLIAENGKIRGDTFFPKDENAPGIKFQPFLSPSGRIYLEFGNDENYIYYPNPHIESLFYKSFGDENTLANDFFSFIDFATIHNIYYDLMELHKWIP